MYNKYIVNGFIDELTKQADIVSSLLKYFPSVGKYVSTAVKGSDVLARSFTKADIASGVISNVGKGYSWFKSPIQKLVGDTVAHTQRAIDTFTSAKNVPEVIQNINRNWNYSLRSTAPKTNIFMKKAPTTEGGNLYRRTPTGKLTHTLFTTGTGAGLLAGALNPGPPKEDIGVGLEEAAKWGPGRAIYLPKLVAYDMPKAMINMVRKPKQVYNENFNQPV